MAQETKQPVQQETQPAGASQAPQTAQPVQPKAQPAQTAAQPQPIKKKSKWWIWLIVGIVVLAIAAVLYFFVF
ncbi:unnamed protein product [marine sediment metagenome]|uniref:Uncharacterized protein n=1 Tax=marine sediment metagenome TaxID=412755 RepID=X1JCY4_9ZZZZ